MVKKVKKTCDGTLVGFRTTFPKYEFKISKKGNIVRKYKNRWTVVCNHGIGRTACNDKTCNSKNMCKHDILWIQCQKCNKKLVCIHKKTKMYCGVCNKKYKCKHGKTRVYCNICSSHLYCCHKK